MTKFLRGNQNLVVGVTTMTVLAALGRSMEKNMIPVCLWATFFIILRFLIVHPIVNLIFAITNHTGPAPITSADKLRLSNDPRCLGLRRALYRLIVYSCFMIGLLFYVYTEPWFLQWNNGVCANVNNPADGPVPYAEMFFFSQLGMYVADMIVEWFAPDHRADYVIHIIHHIVTVMLLCGSYHTGQHRVAVTVLALFGPGDVVLNAGKVVYNLRLPMIGRALALITLVLTWIPTRLYHFTRFILLLQYVCPYVKSAWTPGFVHYYFGLWPLLAMQVFWFFQMIQAAQRAIAKGENLTDHVHDPTGAAGRAAAINIDKKAKAAAAAAAAAGRGAPASVTSDACGVTSRAKSRAQ